MSEPLNIEIEKVSDIERNLKISVPQSAVDAAIEKSVENARKRAAIKGFRKGKAPLDIVRKLYADDINQSAIYELLETNYARALGQIDSGEHSGGSGERIRIIGQPQIKDLDFAPGKPFSFVATVEVMPEIKLNAYKGLKIETLENAVDEKQIDEEISRIRDGQAQYTPVETPRPLAKGDLAVFDVEMFPTDKPQSIEKKENLSLEIGKSPAEATFEEHLLGAMPDDIREFEHEQLHYKIKIREIKSKVLPELNDEFARDLGEFQTFEDFRKRVSEEMRQAAEHRARNFANERVIGALIEANPLQLPKALIEHELNQMMEELKRNLKMRGQSKMFDDDALLNQVRGNYQPQAEKRVQAGLLLDAVSREAGLEVSDAEVEQYLQNLKEKNPKSADDIQRYYRGEEAIHSLKIKLLEEKTLEFLKENAKIIKKIHESELEAEKAQKTQTTG